MPWGELAINDDLNKRGIKRRPKNGHKLLFKFAFLIAISTCALCNEQNREVISTIIPTISSSESSFDCRQSGQECLHDGICSSDGSNCDCSPSPNWFGRQCELRRCAQRHNPCENGAECEKTEQSFRCHCPIGFGGIYCEKQLPTICDGLEHPCLHGNCRLGQSIQEYRCECHFGWTGQNCTEIDYCAENDNCLNGKCVNGPNGQHCECRSGWGGEYCELDVDECQAGALNGGICKNDGKCQNRLGYFFCQCPDGFVGQFCERQNGPDQCEPSPCQNGGKCGMEISATTAIWALDVKQFDWKWECECPNGFEGPRCEQIVDDCALGRMTCVNGGQCVRPWIEQILDENLTEIIDRKLHPAECKCPIGFQGEFCELDVNECEQFGGGICKNGATCMNRHGSFACLCVGGFDGKYCENNIDDCVDNLCYFGSTCVDGISRYNCLCSPDRVGNLCEYPNPCFGANNPCANGQCFADAENGNYSCQCQDGWTGRNCTEDVDECASGSTNRCFNGKCVNEEGGFRCECEFGYTDELCMSLVKYCDANPCQNGATCLNDLGRYDCICLPGYSGKHCEVRAYQDLNKCYLECQNGGICRGPNAEQCECPPPYAGILCEIEKPDPCEQNECAHGSICAPNTDYISYSCQCPPYLSGQFCERRLAPCEYNPCLHGICHKGEKEEDYTCECLPEWTGQLCDRTVEDSDEEDDGKKCPLATNPCQNGGQCIGGQNEKKSAISSVSTFFECICPRGYFGPLCEEKLEEHCEHGCRNGGKCERQKDDGKWMCQCPIGYEGKECEIEMNACLNVSCEHKGKCVNLGAMKWRCDCAPGWSGEKCELNVDECKEMNIICLNGGKCVDRPNNYRCECTKGYGGRHCEISVPVDKFDRTDLVDKENCKKQGCKQKSGNGKCDPECNLVACNFDGGDCSTKQSEPFVNCPQSSYCAHVFADGKCDEVCNNERCLFDGFDCVPRPLAKCPRLAECALRYANGRCDEQCNMAACGWDGGDCDREAEPDPSEQPQILPGELMLILAVNSSELFPNLLRQFLLSLSAHLRASLALSMEKEGQEMKPKLFEWRSDLGIGQRIQIPPELNVTSMFSVHYGQEEGEKGQRRRKRSAENDDNEIIHGVAIFLRVDVTMCNAILHSTSNYSSLAQHRPNYNNPLLGIHSPCFSTVENVAAYVGVAQAKRALQDIGVPILEARRAPDPQTTDWRLYVLSLCLVFILGGAVMVIILKRRRMPDPNKKSARTWIPSIFEQQNSKYGGSTSTLANNSNTNGQIEYYFNANYPVATGVSCASSNASSNFPLMMSHSHAMSNAPSMASLCSQSQQPQLQMGNNNIYCNPPHHHHHQPQIGRQHFNPTIYGQMTDNNQHFMGSTSNNQQPFFQNHNLAQTHQNNNINGNCAIVGPCSRSSSSGIGGSSTEHSPLSHHIHPIHQQNIVPSISMNEEEKAKMHLLTELRKFAVEKNDGLLECQIELEPWKVNAKHERDRNRTLLHLLFQNEHLMGAEQILLANIDVIFKAGICVDAQDEDGTTALSLAVRNRKYLTVKKLVNEYEADPNLEDVDGKTPIYHCCANLPKKEDLKIAEFLIKEIKEEIGLNKLAKGMKIPETPLMRCAILNNPISLKIGKMILERIEPNQRMEFVNQTAGETLKTALHFAAEVGNAEMVKLLVANGANKDAMDREGKTPLFMATEHGQCEAIAGLLELGADRNKADITETKIMDIATQHGYGLIAELFEQYPENCYPQHFHRQNNHLQQQGAKTSKMSTTNDGGNGTLQRRQKGGLKRTAAAANVVNLEKSTVSRPSATLIGSSAPKRAAIEHNVPSGSNQLPTTSSNIPQNDNNVSPPLALAPCGSQSQSQNNEGGTSSSLLTPPNSDQSNYSATPSPNHPPQQNAGFPQNRPSVGISSTGSQPNATLPIPSIPRLKCPTQMDSQLTVRQLPSTVTNQSIPSSPWNPYYPMQPTILPTYHQRHSNFVPPKIIHHHPQSSLAQYSTAISTANPSTNFFGNFSGHQQLDQPEFLRSSLDHLFPSPQDDKILESAEAIRPTFANPLDFRTQLNFGISSIGGFPNGSNVDLGEQQPQNGGNNLSNSLTHLDQISECELLPKDVSHALSKYVPNFGGGIQQQQTNWPIGGSTTFPEQSSPEN